MNKYVIFSKHVFVYNTNIIILIHAILIHEYSNI